MNPATVEIDPDALPPGSRLAEFELERVLGCGGFGIVYLAYDHALQRRVAIKEYMPAALAARRGGEQIAVRSEAHAKTFGIGLRSFVNEARLLARFDHPALVKVYRFWEDHGTAYMAMPYYEGRTLAAVRADMGSPPDEAWLLALADALLGALQALHRDNVFHRDVAPDNILLQPNGAAVLLDFGAARHVIADRSQSLTAILKPNFAPIEQYADSARLRQGPWSDVYGLAAVLYFCLIGRAPVPAALRVLHDELPPLRSLRDELVAADGSHYSDDLLGAIDAALQVRPQERPQDAAAFRALLHGEPVGAPVPPAEAGAALATPASEPALAAARMPLRAAFAPTAAAPRLVTTAWATLGPDLDGAVVRAAAAPPRRAAAARPPAGARRRWGRWLALAVLPGVAGLGLALSHDDAPPAATSAQPAIAAPTAAPPVVPASAAPVGRNVARAPTTLHAAVVAPRPRPGASAPTVPQRAPEAVPTVAQSCGSLSFVPRLWCEARACRQPAHAEDARCIALREQQTRRQPQPF